MSSTESVDDVIDGKYKIDKQLGKGGMGTVFLATHIGTGRPVAVKVIAAQFMQRREFVERFRREAQAAGRLRHPNVVDVTDFGFSVSESGLRTAYLVMEYLDGCTLGEVLEEEGSLPVDFTVGIFEQVCSAVNEAHRQGIIHRDLKPDNIWLEPNPRGGYTVKVLDFGIAKLEETSFSPLAEVSGEYLVRDSSKTRLNEQSDITSVDSESVTGVDQGNATIAGEGETLALDNEGATRVGDASEEDQTMIQDTSVSQTGEAKTVADEPGKTSILKPVEEKGTRLIDGAAATDEPKEEGRGTADLTRAGAVLGTPLYMSPEQCRGEKLTSASDIYSLAVIAYQMLSGKLPFTGDYLEVMEGHKETAPPLISNRKVSSQLKDVVMKSLSKDIDDRPDSAEALASKLRSNSEGLGVLLRRAVVIYSEHLPKFLLLAIVAFLPLILLTYLRITIAFLFGIKVITNTLVADINAAGLGIAAFFLQVVTTAILIGTTTWIVGQILAFPLRPFSLRAAFSQVRLSWKPLTWTVFLSTVLSLLGWVAGAIGGVLGGAHLLAAFGGLLGGTAAGIAAVFFMLAGTVFGGAALSSLFMLIAPSIMMEGISGRQAFRRSKVLTLRSFRTVFPTAVISILVPIILAAFVGFSAGSIIKRFELQRQVSIQEKEIEKMKREGVVAQKAPDTKTAQNKEKKSPDVNIGIRTGPKVEISQNSDEGDKKNDMAKQFSKSVQEGIFELLWTPIAIFFSSFISVITALIYFKARQAGGESLQNLLVKLDDSEHPKSNWERRVRERLIQSGRITTGKDSSIS